MLVLIIEQNINQEYDQAVGQIKEENPYKDIYLNELQNKRDTDLDAVKCMKKKEKKSKKRKVKDDFDERKTSLFANKKIKTMIDFEERVIQVLNL